jgi:hypothetical protein
MEELRWKASSTNVAQDRLIGSEQSWRGGVDLESIWRRSGDVLFIVCLATDIGVVGGQTKYTSKRDGECDVAEQTGGAGLQFHPIPKPAASPDLLNVHERVHKEVTVLKDDCARYGPTSFSATPLAPQQATAASIE